MKQLNSLNELAQVIVNGVSIRAEFAYLDECNKDIIIDAEDGVKGEIEDQVGPARHIDLG
jgi:hypothetical protein